MLYIMASVSLAGLLGLIALLRVYVFPYAPTVECDSPLMVSKAHKRNAHKLMVSGQPLQCTTLGPMIEALPLQLQRSTERARYRVHMVCNPSAYQGARGPP